MMTRRPPVKIDTAKIFSGLTLSLSDKKQCIKKINDFFMHQNKY